MNYINLILYVMGLALILIVFSAAVWGVWALTREVAQYFHTQRNTNDQEAKPTLWVEKHIPAGMADIERTKLEAAVEEAVFLDSREINVQAIHRTHRPSPPIG